jgi:hypothetical protein
LTHLLFSEKTFVPETILKKRKAVEKAKEAREAREVIRRKVQIYSDHGNNVMTNHLINEAFEKQCSYQSTIFRD